MSYCYILIYKNNCRYFSTVNKKNSTISEITWSWQNAKSISYCLIHIKNESNFAFINLSSWLKWIIKLVRKIIWGSLNQNLLLESKTSTYTLPNIKVKLLQICEKKHYMPISYLARTWEVFHKRSHDLALGFSCQTCILNHLYHDVCEPLFMSHQASGSRTAYSWGEVVSGKL